MILCNTKKQCPLCREIISFDSKKFYANNNKKLMTLKQHKYDIKTLLNYFR